MKHSVNKLIDLIPFLFVAVLLGFALMQLSDAQVDVSQAKQELVYQVCEQARHEVSGESEQQCGDIQDSTGIDYLCGMADEYGDRTCWVEARV